MKNVKTKSAAFPYLQDGGELGKLIRAYNWDNTSIGSPTQWPQSLRCYLSLVVNSRFPMFMFWGPDLLCFYNDAYRTRLGTNGRHPGMLGMKGKEALPEVWDFIGPMVNSIMEGGDAILCEDQPLPIFRNGKLEDAFWTFSYSPVIDESGAAAGVFVTCTESVEQKKLAHQLHQKSETVKLAIEAGELGIVEVDLQTEDVIISERIEEIFGLKSGSKRSDFLSQMHPDDLVLREHAYKKALHDGRLEYESRVFRKDGSVRWIRLKGSIFFNEANTRSKMVSIVQDITDQKLFAEELSRQVNKRTQELEEVQKRLLSSNAYLQKIIDIFTTALQVLEPVVENGEVVDFRYKLTNQSYAAYTGLAPGELEGKRVSEIFPGYFDTDSFRNIREVAITGQPRLWENHYPADGLDIYNEMGAVNMDGDIIVHLTDFTKLKQLQLELERNIAELERSNENLEEFAHAASHDLKEPIRKIQVFTAQLKDQLLLQLNDAQLRSFERIYSASKRMGQLVDDLLMYSHVSEMPHEKEPVELSEIVGQVLEDLELDVNEKSAIIEVSMLPRVFGYRRQLQQLFQNLISNAIKYSKPGVAPVIDVSAGLTRENGLDYDVITIRDNGIGFDNEYSEKIFQMFMRLHNKNEYSGTGVGLSIVKKVVDNHKGFIRAEGRVGDGAVFHVHLPAEHA